MSRILRVLVMGVALLGITAAVYSCGTFGFGGSKSGSATMSSVFSTDLIAGDGAGNGAGNGTDAGDISFSDDGTNLNISIDMDDANNWSLGGLHIYIGDGMPVNSKGKKTVAPGQFPFGAADGTWAVNGDEWNGSFPLSQFTYDATNPLTILVHGEGLQGAGLGFFEASCQGEFASYGLYYGSTDVLVGTVTLNIVGSDVVCSVSINQPSTFLISEAHFYLDLAANGIPPMAAGQWPYNSGVLNPGVTTYTFPPVPLSTLGIDAPLDQIMADLTFAFHAAIYNANGGASESATAWNADCRVHFLKNNGQPHWKSYTTCADLIDETCVWVWNEGDEGTEDTLWATNTDPYDGWFPNLGFNRWGWAIQYQPAMQP